MKANPYFIRNLEQKITWLLITAFLSSQVWLITNNFQNKEDIAVVKTQGNERLELQREIYNKVGDNYIMLQSKANETENNNAHIKLLEGQINLNLRLLSVERTLNLIYHRTGLAVMIDTTHQNDIAESVVNKVIVVAAKIDTLKKMITLDSRTLLPLKDTSILKESYTMMPFSYAPIYRGK